MNWVYTLIAITLFIFICVYIYYDYTTFFKYKLDKIYVKSPVDNNVYLVNDNDKKNEIADTLAKLNLNLLLLKMELKKIKNKDQDTILFLENLESIKINESNLNDYSTFVMNKQDIYMCLIDKKTQNMYDLNLLTYVFIHELAHIYTYNEEGHGSLFQRNFKFLLSIAKEKGIYKEIDFETNNQLYCGVKIKNNVDL